MEEYSLHIRLERDTTFGRGDGMAGLVDQEVDHDLYGLPFLRGRALKGLLVEECANILYALSEQNSVLAETYQQAAERLFGRPGAGLEDATHLRVGDALLPADLRAAVRQAVEAERISRLDILDALTDVRRQTALDETGKPTEKSLRSVRVILRDTCFIAPMSFAGLPDERDTALLAACVKAFRRAGLGRNRGCGRLAVTLHDSLGRDVTNQLFSRFAKEVKA